MNGIERRIDKLGRLVLPISYRNALGISENSRVRISLCDGEISIIPIEEKCVMCGANKDINPSLRLCAVCIEKVKMTAQF